MTKDMSPGFTRSSFCCIAKETPAAKNLISDMIRSKLTQFSSRRGKKST